MEWNEFVDILFPLGFIFASIIGLLAYKNNWKIIDWF
jgi:hypothetical protein